MMGWSGRWDGACGGSWDLVFLSACGLVIFVWFPGERLALWDSVGYCVGYAWYGSVGSIARHQLRPFFVAVPLAFSHLPGETFWPGCWIPRFSGRRGGAWRRA